MPGTNDNSESTGRASRMTIGKLRNWLLVAVGLIALLWLVTAVTASQVLSRASPKAALALWPDSAAAQIETAEVLVRTNSGGLSQASELATRALDREPVNVRAVRTLAQIAATHGENDKSERLFRHAERLSRRDSPTQLWLIEDSVKQGDLERTLQHYHRALSTSEEARPLLLPILADAATNRLVADRTAARLAKAPPWRDDFLTVLSRQSSPEAISAIFLRFTPPLERPDQRASAIGALERLADAGHYAEAFRIYGRIAGTRPKTELIHPWPGAGDRTVPPFEWLIHEAEAVDAAVEQQDSGKLVLRLYGDGGRAQKMAQQLLLLPAGRYDLTIPFGGVEGDGPSHPMVVLECHRRTGSPLLQETFPTTPEEGGRLQRSFVVPADCPAQLISIWSGDRLENAESVPWFEAPRIVRR